MNDLSDIKTPANIDTECDRTRARVHSPEFQPKPRISKCLERLDNPLSADSDGVGFPEPEDWGVCHHPPRLSTQKCQNKQSLH